MGRMEENLNPMDVYIFNRIKCRHPNVNIAEYCEYVGDYLVESILNSLVHDIDYTYFEDINASDPQIKFETLTNESLSELSQVGECYHPDVSQLMLSNSSEIGWTLMSHIRNIHYCIFTHLPGIFEKAQWDNVSYRDYQLALAGDRIVLRLLKGVM